MARVFSLFWFPVLSVNLFVSVNGWNLPNLIPFISLFFQVPCAYAIFTWFVHFCLHPVCSCVIYFVIDMWMVQGVFCLSALWSIRGLICRSVSSVNVLTCGESRWVNDTIFLSEISVGLGFDIRWWNESTIAVKKSAARQQWYTRRRATHHHHRSSFRLSFGHLKKKKKRSLLNILRVVAHSLLMDPFVSSWTNPTPCLVFRCSVFRLIQIRTPSLIIRLSFPTCSRLEAKGCTHWLNLYDCYQPRCSKHHCCRQLFLAPTRFFFVV